MSKTIFKSTTRFILIAFTLLFFGCASSVTHKLYQQVRATDTKVAELRAPSEVSILSVNGKSTPLAGKVLSQGETRYEILPGSHEVRLRYRDVWEENDDDFKVVQSQPVVLKLEAQAGAVYRVKYEKPQDLDSANALARNFAPWIIEDQTITVDRAPVVEAQPIADPTLSQGEKLVSYSGMEVKERASLKQPQAEVGAVTSSSADKPTSDLSADELLKFWWKRASAEERTEFLSWISR